LSTTIGIEQLSEAIEQELTIYNNNVIDGIKTQAKKSMSELVKKTKATAPVGKRKRHYRDNISSKKLSENDRSVSYIWYVKGSDYRLSHLLEHGHAKKNGGRTRATHFIENASTPILDDYVHKVEEVIKNG
jgi:hypothetical protein